MRIGLLGGSFDPAHQGHRHLALLAMRRLRLDQIWLLVSPGNPLKTRQGMNTLSERLEAARRIADGRRVIATDLESALRTRYTADTLRHLTQRFPCVRFVWLMGADNLSQLPRWRHWLRIVHTVPFAVMPRPTYSAAARAGLAARRLRHSRRPEREAGVLADHVAPAWVFLNGRENSLSATELRRAHKGED